MLLRKLGLIVWKNLLLRKRQWVVTFFEVFFPILFVPLIIFLLKSIAGTPPGDGETIPLFEEEQTYDEFDESYIIQKFSSGPCGDSRKQIVAYTPKNTETDKLMSEVLAQICSDIKIIAENYGDKGEPEIAAFGFNTESELESMVQTKWKGKGEFLGAVVFATKLEPTDKIVSYTIRMPGGRQCPSNTEKLLPEPGDEDYGRVGPPSMGNPKSDAYLNCGFLGFQLILDKALTKSITLAKERAYEVHSQAFPYPTYKLPRQGLRIFNLFIFYVGLAFGSCFLIPSITRNVVAEKQSGISELLRLTGVPGWIQWLGWWIHIVGPQLITISITLILMYKLTLPTGQGDEFAMLDLADFSLVGTLLLLVVFASVAFGLLICAVIKKPTIATTIAEVIWIGSMSLGFVFLSSKDSFSMEMTLSLCVLPNFALAVLLKNMVFAEFTAFDESDKVNGVQWEWINGQIGGIYTHHVILIMLADVTVFLLLAIYLDGILPSEHGVKRPIYYFNCERGKKHAPTKTASAPELPPTDSPAEDDKDANENEEQQKSVGEKESNQLSSKSKPEAPETVEPSTPDVEPEAPATNASFEPEPAGADIGVEIQDICKKFGQKVAVNGVSLKMFTGDIFALLGHNGAGKTTLISMLTGFFAPTSGTAYVNGYDIRKNLDKARESMGLCPQTNMQFDWLSVSEQLCIFGMLRGLSSKQAAVETQMLLGFMHIHDKAHTRASKLSGGQKRKLSLAMSLIGGTKVVILDEPTSGMDPQARREIWDLLLQLRGQRTILLTTHFMEEADVLGDRIGIMASGRLQCCGSTEFLKKYYGTGYTLKLSLYPKEVEIPVNEDPSADHPPDPTPTGDVPQDHALQEDEPVFQPNPEAEAILALIQKHVPDASFKADALWDFYTNDVFISLPGETATTAVLCKMMVDLTAQKEKLNISTIGLSQTTMDEVFIRVGAIAEAKFGAPIQDIDEQETFERAPKERNRFVVQYMSLLVKKCLYSLRKWVTLVFESLVPILLCILIAYQNINHVRPQLIPSSQTSSRSASSLRSRGRIGGLSAPKNLPGFNLDKYKDPWTYYSKDFDTSLKELSKEIGASAQKTSNVTKSLLDEGYNDRIRYKRKLIVAFDLDLSSFNGKIVAMYNLFPYHSAPLAMNIATNALLRQAGKSHIITVSSHPFPKGENDKGKSNGRSVLARALSTVETRSARVGLAFEDNSVAGTTCEGKSSYAFLINEGRFKADKCNNSESVMRPTAAFLVLGMAILLAHFIVAPIEENVCKVKQLQTMTGVSPLVYWGATFTVDYLIFFLITCVLLFIFLIFEHSTYIVLTTGWGWLVFIFIMMVYGYAGIFFSYLRSLKSATVTGGFVYITFVHLTTGLMLGILVPDPPTYDGVILIIRLLFIYPFIIIGRCFPSFSFVRAIWYWAEISAINSDCPLLKRNDGRHCPEPVPYMMWDRKEVRISLFQRSTEVTYRPQILQEIFFMLFNGIVYMVWLLLVEYKIIRMVKQAMCHEEIHAFPVTVTDDDVVDEANRVNFLVESGQTLTECLLVQGLCKNFGSFAAVSQLSFGVHYGECFGLLGINGAGKTTAFRMITGDETPSTGNAFGFGLSLQKNPTEFFANVGYCPQFDAILVNFTGKEMLQLFAGLRGIPFKLRGQEATKWLKRMGLHESANVKCGRYSGGMKRRLSTAIAMIGDPALILLDEPTSGVDPVARRQFWKILSKLRASGQSIILTSHSMEECEALCSRLGIMVNGQFRCFGGVQHLKNKFAQGYSLTIRLKSDLQFEQPELQEELQNFELMIIEKFQPCQLKDKHQNLMQFQLQDASITWDGLFKLMEQIKAEYAHLIEDYAVNESSLEEVFLSFAKQQYPERKADVSLLKQICTCSC